jgi:CubicO group peptidase (beta-lactamase class C family)
MFVRHFDMHGWRVWVARVLGVCVALMALTLTSGAVRSQETTAPLEDYEGVYDYRDGITLVIVGEGGRLFAVIGEAKYRLRAAGTDTFANGSGDRVPFTRDASGRVTGFVERGDSFRRRSAIVPPEARTLFEPRPRLGGKVPAYRFAAPLPFEGDRVSSVEAGGFTPDVAARLVNGVVDGTYPDVHSILIYHHHALRMEEYFYGYDARRPHQMRSLTKSIVALLAGIAVDKGLLRPDEPVFARLGYPAYANPDPRKERVTIIDLLSNRSGLACNDHDGASPGNEVKLYEAQDWVKAFVDLPMIADPGTVGRYCSGGFFTVGRIIERAAGKPLADFAQEVLFGPLRVGRENWTWTFTLDRSQRNEFAQIYLRPRDLLKVGLLIAQRGEWQDRRVVSAAWIDKAIARQSKVDDSDYGLGIWHRWYNVTTASGDRRVDTIMLSGNGGQKLYLVPSLDLVAVFTGGAYNVESPVNDMMARVLLPALLVKGGPRPAL